MTVFATIPAGQTAPSTSVPAAPVDTAAPTTIPPSGISPACEAALNAPPAIAGTYRFSDLGVDPSIIVAMKNPVHLFASTGGGPFTSVQAPDALNSQNSGTSFLTSVSDGFLIGRIKYPSGGSGNQIATTGVVHSPDGKTWTDFGEVNGQVLSSGVTGGHFTLVVNDEKGTRLVQLKGDGTGFEDVVNSSSPTTSALSMTGAQMTIGDAGYLAAFANDGGPFMPAVTVQHSRFTFLVTQDPKTGMQQVKVTEDATGSVVADGPLSPDEKSDPSLKLDKHIKWSVDSQSDITIVDDNGKTLVSIGVSNLFNQISQQQQAESVKSMRILDSQDGITWSATSISDLVDLTKVPVIGASNLIVDKDRYIVNLLVARTDGGPADTITFVGRRG
jgi:hypothetical protein